VTCRHCGAPVSLPFIDLGFAPPSNAYLTDAVQSAPEPILPLRVMVCQRCWLVQTDDFAAPTELFDADYAYYSSVSSSWLAHSRLFVDQAVRRFHLGPTSHVVEVASNDGYLLQYFQARNIPCLGIEPTAGPAGMARSRGIATVEAFFGRELGGRLALDVQADLTVAINVLAHVPDINDFVAGFEALLAPTGIATFEFPHLLRLVEGTQFDTIYHEHFSYLSLTTVRQILGSAGLEVFDVEELPTHGGSIRVFARRAGSSGEAPTPSLARVQQLEDDARVTSPTFYTGFQAAAERVRDGFRTFLEEKRAGGWTVAGYGAAAKGNTLLNFAGVGPDLLCAVADANPAKQGKYLPGSRIPIVTEEALSSLRPDYVVILPWNLRGEIMGQLDYLRAAGTKFVTAVPYIEVHQ
jgi:hypothetical protein